MRPPICYGPGCSRPATVQGLCYSHYRQRLRGGDLAPLTRQGEPMLRVSLRVSEGCRERILESPADARVALERWARRTPRTRTA